MSNIHNAIDTIEDMRSEVEEGIQKIILDFELRSGMVITDISIARMEFTGHDRITSVPTVRTEIKLPRIRRLRSSFGEVG